MTADISAPWHKSSINQSVSAHSLLLSFVDSQTPHISHTTSLTLSVLITLITFLVISKDLSKTLVIFNWLFSHAFSIICLTPNMWFTHVLPSQKTKSIKTEISVSSTNYYRYSFPFLPNKKCRYRILSMEVQELWFCDLPEISHIHHAQQLHFLQELYHTTKVWLQPFVFVLNNICGWPSIYNHH